ncbi:MAG: sulfite exporter TauE/SafE family protein [Phycisphaerales bacterium]|nr:sulfite exporter TauE/SafE family protein [Phycisphaerales bacterium]
MTPSELTFLATSFGLGALHALEPGHGKSVVAAYMLGNRGRWHHAVLLGGTVAFTHTAGILVLGLIAWYAAVKLDMARIQSGVSVAAGVLILAVGAWMLWRGLSARGGHSGHAHPHDHHEHHHPPAAGHAASWWSVTAIGLSAGILPCPAALAPLLYAFGVRKGAQGVLATVLFSLGLALMLTLVALLVLRARGWADERLERARWMRHLPIVSAVIVCVLGVVVLVRGIQTTAT